MLRNQKTREVWSAVSVPGGRGAGKFVVGRWAAVGFLVSLASGVARADEASDLAAARAFGVEGVQLADQGKCDKAIDKLTRAEALHHAPTTAVRLGECEVTVGRLVAGTERLRKLVREQLPSNAPPVFVTAVARAEKVLAEASPRIPKLRISVVYPERAPLTLKVDGETISEVFLDNERPTDPGTHRIEASAPGCVTQTASVTLKEKEVQSIRLTLALEPETKSKPQAAASKVSAPPSPAPEPAPSSAASTPVTLTARAHEGGMRSTLTWVSLGVGVVGLATGGIAGTMALILSRTLERVCQNRECPSTQTPTLIAARNWATASTVGWIVAGAGVFTALVLWASNPDTKFSLFATAEPSTGLAQVGLWGRF